MTAGLCGGCGGKPDLQRGAPANVPSATGNANPEAAALDVKKRLAAAKPGPTATILQLWERMQAGVPQLAVVSYDRRVVKALGLATVEGGLLAQGSLFRTSVPTVRSSERTPVGLLVAVTARSLSGSVELSYLMRKVGGRWVISFDSVLEQGLDGYGRANTPFQRNVANTERAAQQHGAALAERYRLLTTPPRRAAP